MQRSLRRRRGFGNPPHRLHTRPVEPIKQDGELFIVDVFGAGPDGPIHWPTCRTNPLANLEEEAGQRTFALSATFDFEFMTAETYIRVNKGVLVIVLFASFRDGSKRSDYVNREFFYRP